MSRVFAVLVGIVVLSLFAVGYSGSSQESNPILYDNFDDYHYFVRDSVFVDENEYSIGLQKIQRVFSTAILVDSQDEADVLIVVSTLYGVIPGQIYIDYSDDAFQIEDYVLSHTVEVIVLQVEEDAFDSVSYDLENQFAEMGVSLRKSIFISAKEYYRFLLRLRQHSEAIHLFRQAERDIVVDNSFSDIGRIARIDHQASFEEINGFLLGQ